MKHFAACSSVAWHYTQLDVSKCASHTRASYSTSAPSQLCCFICDPQHL